jgi:hypothetical protein
MPLTKIAFWGFYCCRCGHRWVPRGVPQEYQAKGDEERLRSTDPGTKPPEPEEEPLVCPKCKSPYWNRAKLK